MVGNYLIACEIKNSIKLTIPISGKLLKTILLDQQSGTSKLIVN